MKLNPHTTLYGFLGGPKGILENETLLLTEELLRPYRNQGGFDLLGSGRTKIETEEQFAAAQNTMEKLQLDGLVIIGGDDSNTNAAFLAQYFLQNGCGTRVIGVPKTIDGDLKNDYVEISFGFDTASKVYSEIIGNIARDALSAKKYYHVIKLMGRSASHIALECALQTHPNYTFISEEIAAKGATLDQLVNEVADMVAERAAQGKNYGVILIPEGVIEFIPQIKSLIRELNQLLAAGKSHENLSKESRAAFDALPEKIRSQLLLERDPHGNVQVSKIETEQLFIELFSKALKKRGVKFNAQAQFCGYEGRSAFPSDFDCNYCYALGHVAALLIDAGATGYMAVVQQLGDPVEKWAVLGVPLLAMMTIEARQGQDKAVIKKGLVDLSGKPFEVFKKMRGSWMLEDDYQYPGPIQFFGPKALTEAITATLRYENSRV